MDSDGPSSARFAGYTVPMALIICHHFGMTFLMLGRGFGR